MTHRRTAREFAQKTGRRERTITDLVRRKRVRATDGARWTLHGYVDENGHAEMSAVEVFSNVGFTARPGGGPDAGVEAIVVTVGASKNQAVIVATRDRSMEQAAIEAMGLEAGETMVYSASSVIKLTKDGEILIGVMNGEFKAVALDDHTHAAPPITGQAQYVDPDARTGPPDSVSQNVKVT